nr:uncharacterized protein LOC109776643 [Aegilops tauschii subsp. strangulata]
MMQELGLKEEDLDDVVFDEKDAPQAAARWIAVARVNSDKPYSQFWFFRNMRAAWDLAQEAKFKPLEENLYTIQFSCLGDWERVMQEGPWHFRGDAVILKEYDGVTKPSNVKLDTIEIWIQIHDVPILYAHLVPSLASKVGEVLFTESQSHDFTGNFYRVGVRINVTKPLKNAVSMIRGGERQIYKVKYEKLPDWCAVCGMLGHLFKEQGTGIHPPSALVFKELRASWFMRNGSGPGGGRGRRGGRRGGRIGRSGRSRSQQGGDDEEHTEQVLEMLDAERLKKRGSEPTQHQSQVVLSNNSDQSSAVTNGTMLALPPPSVPLSPSAIKETKRAKTVPETEKVSA